MADISEENQKEFESINKLNQSVQHNTALKQENEKVQKELNKETKKGLTDTEKGLEKTNKLLDEIEENLGDVKSGIKSIGTITGGIFATLGVEIMGLKGMVSELIKQQNEFTRIAGTIKQPFDELNNAYIGVQKNLGASVHEASTLVKTLAQGNLQGNLQEATNSAFLFSRITNMATEEISEMSLEMNKGARLSTKNISDIYASMGKVIQGIGMSDKAIKAATNKVTDLTKKMGVLGKDPAQIKQMATNTTRLIAELDKVGVSAQTASEWIDKMTDPEQLTENIGLMAMLGVNIGDAINGNYDAVTNQMGMGLADFGEQLKSMGNIAGPAFAKAMGVSYNEAIKAAEGDFGEGIEIKPVDEQSLDVLKELKDNITGLGQQVQDNVSMIRGRIMEFLEKLPAVCLIIFPFIHAGLKAIKNKLKKGAKSFISELAIGLEKTGNKLTSNFEEAGKKLNKEVDTVYKTTQKIRLEGDSKKLAKEVKQGEKTIGTSVGFGSIKETRKDRKASGKIEGLESTKKVMEHNIDIYKSKLEELGKINDKFLSKESQEKLENQKILLNKQISLEAAKIKSIEDSVEKQSSKMSNGGISNMNAVSNKLKTGGGFQTSDIENITKAIKAGGEEYKNTLLDTAKSNVELANSSRDAAKAQLDNKKEEAKRMASIFDDKKKDFKGKNASNNFDKFIKSNTDALKTLSANEGLSKEAVKTIETLGKNQSISKQQRDALKAELTAKFKDTNAFLTKDNEQLAKLESDAVVANNNLAKVQEGIIKAVEPKKESKIGGVAKKVGGAVGGVAKKVGKGVGGFAISKITGLDLSDPMQREKLEKKNSDGTSTGKISAGKVIGKAAANGAKTMLLGGVAGIAMAFLNKVLQKIMSKPKVMDQMDKVMNAVMKLVDSFIDALMPVIDALMNALMPIMKVLMKVILKIVQICLPPILYVLGGIFKAVEAIIKLFKKKEGDETGLGDELIKAADEIKNMDLTMSDTAEEITDAAEEEADNSKNKLTLTGEGTYRDDGNGGLASMSNELDITHNPVMSNNTSATSDTSSKTEGGEASSSGEGKSASSNTSGYTKPAEEKKEEVRKDNDDKAERLMIIAKLNEISTKLNSLSSIETSAQSISSENNTMNVYLKSIREAVNVIKNKRSSPFINITRSEMANSAG